MLSSLKVHIICICVSEKLKCIYMMDLKPNFWMIKSHNDLSLPHIFDWYFFKAPRTIGTAESLEEDLSMCSWTCVLKEAKQIYSFKNQGSNIINPTHKTSWFYLTYVYTHTLNRFYFLRAVLKLNRKESSHNLCPSHKYSLLHY